MKTLAFILILQLPLCLFAQKNTWSVYSELGFNLSLNHIHTRSGNPSYMHNKKTMSGNWGLGVAYQFNKRSLLTLGLDHAAYTYHYYYNYANGAGAGSKSSVFIWGFPVGLANNWLQNECMQFSTGYGLKYRLNRLGSPFGLESFKEEYNRGGQLIFSQETREFNQQQQNHLLAAFVYAQFLFKVKESIHLGFKFCYNQGLNTHESFEFEAINRLPLQDLILEDRYQYSSKASYISLGISFHYVFIRQETNTSELEAVFVNK